MIRLAREEGHTNVAMKLLESLGFHYRLKKSKIRFEELVRMSVN